MDGTASGLSACHQHDILSRQAMMYLLTRGWSSAHTSLAMTPEHSDMSAEYCCRKPARAEHSRSMCLSSPKAPVRHNLQTRLLRGNRTCLPCSMGSMWAPMRNLRSLCSLALPMGTSCAPGRPREPTMVCAYFHPISGAQPGIRRHSVKRHSALMLEGCKQVMRMNPDGDASCDGYVLSSTTGSMYLDYSSVAAIKAGWYRICPSTGHLTEAKLMIQRLCPTQA